MQRKQEKQDTRLTRVLIRETGQVYRSIDAAVEALSIPRYIAMRLIKSGNPTRSPNGMNVHLEWTALPTTEQKIEGRVRVIESGRVYKSIKEAAEQTGIVEDAIKRLVISGNEGRTVYGQRIHLELLTD